MSKDNKTEEAATKSSEKPMCGLVMPIADTQNCSAAHWSLVKKILQECLTEADYNSRLVSDSPETGVIHKRIVDNLYQDPIIICDISDRNPNVLFELGMRLTFDKPVVIIKDDETPFIFDISLIEYISYPRSLIYNEIQEFKIKLAEKVAATFKAGQDKAYSPFLKHFKDLKPSKLEVEEIGPNELLNKKIDDLYSLIQPLVLQSSNNISLSNAARQVSISGMNRQITINPLGQVVEHVSAIAKTYPGGVDKFNSLPIAEKRNLINKSISFSKEFIHFKQESVDEAIRKALEVVYL